MLAASPARGSLVSRALYRHGARRSSPRPLLVVSVILPSPVPAPRVRRGIYARTTRGNADLPCDTPRLRGLLASEPRRRRRGGDGPGEHGRSAFAARARAGRVPCGRRARLSIGGGSMLAALGAAAVARPATRTRPVMIGGAAGHYSSSLLVLRAERSNSTGCRWARMGYATCSMDS